VHYFYDEFQVNKSQLQQLKDRFAAFLQGETHIAADEAFINAVTSYYEVICDHLLLHNLNMFNVTISI